MNTQHHSPPSLLDAFQNSLFKCLFTSRDTKRMIAARTQCASHYHARRKDRCLAEEI
ncbi:MAG: hypothetical protein ACRDIV_01220 [Ktedonobacteraceae bacterium]